MEKSLVSSLGGAHAPPNVLAYGQSAPKPVWQHTCLRTGIGLLLVCLLLCSPSAGLTAQSPTTPPTAIAPAPKQHTASSPPVAAPAAKKPSQPKGKAFAKSKATVKKHEPPHADAWAFSTQKPRPVDSIWTQGLAPQAIKKAAVSGLKDKALKKGLTAPEVPPVVPPRAHATPPLRKSTGKEMPLAKGMHLRGDVDNVSSGWHSSGLKNDLRIDQDVNRQETNIYGAYADIEAGDDVTLSAGPEFSHTRTQSATQGSTHTQTDSGSLGLGVHLKWDF